MGRAGDSIGGIHPVRDLLLKGGTSPNARYLLYALCWIPTLVHGLVFEQNLSLPPALWLSVCLSALGLVLYYFGTFQALQVSDLSIYYPIIRCSPVAILLFSFVVLGVQYSLLVVVSVLMIFVGTIMLQKPKGGIFGNRLALLAAVLALVGSAIYTIVDARAMQAVQPGAYLFYIYLLVSAGLLGLLAIDTHFTARPRGRTKAPHRAGWWGNPGVAVVAGAGGGGHVLRRLFAGAAGLRHGRGSRCGQRCATGIDPGVGADGGLHPA